LQEDYEEFDDFSNEENTPEENDNVGWTWQQNPEKKLLNHNSCCFNEYL
jgi:hypothetical protein